MCSKVYLIQVYIPAIAGFSLEERMIIILTTFHSFLSSLKTKLNPSIIFLKGNTFLLKNLNILNIFIFNTNIFT